MELKYENGREAALKLLLTPVFPSCQKCLHLCVFFSSPGLCFSASWDGHPRPNCLLATFSPWWLSLAQILPPHSVLSLLEPLRFLPWTTLGLHCPSNRHPPLPQLSFQLSMSFLCFLKRTSLTPQKSREKFACLC